MTRVLFGMSEGIALIASGKILRGFVRLKVSCYWLVLLLISILVSGCALNRTGGVNPTLQPSETSVDKISEKKADSKRRGKTEKITSDNTIKATASVKTGAVKEKKNQDQPDLDRQLREAADELALKLGHVKAMRLCYVTRDNEWWVILYQDIGPVIDVRNFIWNWEEQIFRPYLVVKRIPKNELHETVTRHERGKRCVILKPPSAKTDDGSEKPSPQQNDSKRKR